MRKFGTDAPEFFCFQLGSNKKVYKIPLAYSLANKELFALEEAEGDYKKQLEWLRAYMGDAVDTLTVRDTGGIFDAWREESEKAGAAVGES